MQGNAISFFYSMLVFNTLHFARVRIAYLWFQKLISASENSSISYVFLIEAKLYVK